MCHDNLKFEFEPHVNFIIGDNGSGKSAVATGIILALGGRSRVTGRCTSVKGFVKKGKKNAVVSVTLKNCGDLPYEPEKYGNKVIVERHFTTDNSNSYKIMSETGIVISKSKEDLNDILTYMDIHVDNPTTILTQDMSRAFLISKNADKNLYKLFYESTGLQKLKENYAKVNQLKKAAESTLETKKKLLQETEKELQQWEKLMNHAKTCSDLQNELLWAIALEIEKKLLDKQEKFEEAQNEVIKIQKEKEITQAEHFKLSETFKSHDMHRQNLEKEIESIESSLKQLKSQQQSVTKDVREHAGLLNRYKRENDRLNNDIMQAENALNEALQKNKDDADAEQRERDKKIQMLEARLSGINSELKEKTKIWNFYLDEEKDLEKICGTLIKEKEDALNKKLSIEKALRQFKFSMSKESDYGSEMQNALTSISSCNEFIKPPKGPIGQYLEVLDLL
ncbi:structural maintenance of chromosomes protein 6-like isoform X2 [Stegodyphus dumicola]|nr:structural maintenance of chromosomes protein 6-like isoform X2 [Stegodyphus dumicola]